MRAGIKDSGYLYDGNEFIGVNLGWDYCSEHEIGINRLKNDFDICGSSKEVLGLEASKIRLIPKNFSFHIKNDKTYLVYNSYWMCDGNIEDIDKIIIQEHYDTNKELLCSWDERSFGIRTIGKDGREKLTALLKAFEKKDIVIFLGGSKNPFANSGLNICIYSKIPEEIKNNAINKDIDNIKLKETAEATGIYNRLEEAQKQKDGIHRKCSYYALSPAWLNKNIKEETAYDIMFWLNPIRQNKYNFGWYSVEELDQWIKGEGPIIKNGPKT